jgi:hypothetical protein
VSLDTATVARLRIAKRWEVVARHVMYVAMAGIVLSWITERFWIAILAVFSGMPAAWLFNLRCPSCAWLVYRAYGTAKPKYSKDQFLAPLYSKQLWKQPDACSKCGQPFRSNDINLKAVPDAQTH